MPDTPRFLIRRPTTKKAPQASDLLSGEIALGYPTGNNVPVLYYKDPLNSDNVVVVGSEYFALSNHNHDGVYQPANSILDGLVGLGTSTGIVIKTGNSSFATKSIVAGSSKVSVTNGSGTGAGNISIDVVESAININNLGGIPLSVNKGGTGLTSLGSSNTLLGVNSGGSSLEYKTLLGTVNQVTVTHGSGTITLGTPQDIAPTSSPTFAGLTINNGSIAVNDGSTPKVVIGSDGNVSVAGNITIGGTPSEWNHAVTKSYVDALAQGLRVREPVRVATTGNITLSGLQTIDGVTLQAGDRVLVWKQTNAAQNGVYVASSGTWTRASDFDEGSEFPGATVLVKEGETYADTMFVCVNDTEPTLGTTPINFSILSTPLEIMAGDGLALDGRVMYINLASNSGLEIVSDALKVKLESSNPTLKINASGELGVKFGTDSGLATGTNGLYVTGTPLSEFYINGTTNGMKLIFDNSSTLLKVTRSNGSLIPVLASSVKLKQSSDTAGFATLQANSTANTDTSYTLDYISGYTSYTILTNRSIIDCGTY